MSDNIANITTLINNRIVMMNTYNNNVSQRYNTLVIQ